MTAMDITIHSSFLPHDDPDASLAFYRDTFALSRPAIAPEVKRLALLGRTEVLRNG